MVATNWFVSVPFREVVGGETNNAGLHSGTSTSGADFIELRMMQYTTGTTSTGLTRKDVLIALEVFERWILESGLIGDGANLPPI
jgi:hypothetical protein